MSEGVGQVQKIRLDWDSRKITKLSGAVSFVGTQPPKSCDFKVAKYVPSVQLFIYLILQLHQQDQTWQTLNIL